MRTYTDAEAAQIELDLLANTLSCGHSARQVLRIEFVDLPGRYRFECPSCGAWWEYDLRAGFLGSSKLTKERERMEKTKQVEYQNGVYGVGI